MGANVFRYSLGLATLVSGAALSAMAHAAVMITLMGNITSDGSGPLANYGKAYEGDYTLTATYTVNTMMKMGMTVFDPTGSTITFTDKTKKFGPFDTLAIPITSATIVNGKVTSFTFDATDWYKNLPAYLTQNGISGTITLGATNSASIDASYKYVPKNPAKEGTQLNYFFMSPVANPLPAPGGGNFNPFPGVPEPATWAMMLVGLFSVGAMARYARYRTVKAA